MERSIQPSNDDTDVGRMLGTVLERLDRYIAEQRKLWAHLLTEDLAEADAETVAPSRVA